MDGEAFVHLVHVLMAVIWVGGAFSLQIVGTRTWRSRRTERMAEMAADFEFIGTRIFTPASLLILISGIWLVATSDGEFAFRQFWVYSSLAAFAYSFASGLLYLSPQLAKAKEVWAAEGATSERGAQIMRRLLVVSRIELAILFFVVFNMVVKPFS